MRRFWQFQQRRPSCLLGAPTFIYALKANIYAEEMLPVVLLKTRISHRVTKSRNFASCAFVFRCDGKTRERERETERDRDRETV